MSRPTLIESPEASPADKVLSRVKRRSRPDGLLQCPRCGSRNVMSIRNGVIVKDERVVCRGTLIDARVCADCYRRGERMQMVPGGQGPKLVR